MVSARGAAEQSWRQQRKAICRWMAEPNERRLVERSPGGFFEYPEVRQHGDALTIQRRELYGRHCG